MGTQDRTALYEQLVGLCESYTPEDHNSFETMFAIMDVERKIGTIEAQLIVSAFLSRARLQQAQRDLAVAFKRAETLATEGDWAQSVRQNSRKDATAAEVAF